MPLPRARDRVFQRTVGFMLILTACALLFILTMNRHEGSLFKKVFHLQAVTARANGMSINATVTMAGLKVGRVSAIDLTDGHQVALTLEVDAKYQDKLRTDSRAVLSKPLLGSPFIELSMGRPDQAPLQDGDRIASVLTPDINDIVADIPQVISRIDDAGKEFALIGADARALLQSARDSVESVKPTLAHVHQTVLNTEQLTSNLAHDSRDVRQLMEKAGGAMTRVDTLLSSVQESSKSLTPILGKLDTAMSDIVVVSKELRLASPQIPEVLGNGNRVLRETDAVLQGAKSNILLRGFFTEPVPLPVLPTPR